ncbi:leucine-rich repeat extensin-like protein 6 [Ananas comosus]|uniref:Leucine-rich repeat extensin-like protein 6 n=1 Tax=Ananas comosus TaxID=4615 RepID=A0A6P5FQ43_ANACO|nr:leucine-rich repeat extensin-like protein 6 [Ananas comosus]
MLSLQLALTVIVAATSLITCTASEQHDAVPGTEVKCTCNPCGCMVGAPPPPSPPPPSLPPPSNPSSSYCPPPPPVPPAPYLYIVGNPGSLYPVDPGFYPSNARRELAVPPPVFVVFGFLALLFFRA